MQRDSLSTKQDPFEANSGPGHVVTRTKFTRGGGVISCECRSGDNDGSTIDAGHYAAGIIKSLGCVNDDLLCQEIHAHARRHKRRLEDQRLAFLSEE